MAPSKNLKFPLQYFPSKRKFSIFVKFICRTLKKIEKAISRSLKMPNGITKLAGGTG
jgi:hypothetical protein